MKPQTPILVALADDHAILRKGLAELITDFEDMQIIADANNGKELIEQVGKAGTIPDIFILDINMPVMNGYETAKYIRKTWPHAGILALSMYDNEFNVIRMLRCGANGYVLKDAEPAELKKAINEIIEHDFYHSEIVTGRLLRILHDNEVENDLDLNENEIAFLGYCCTELTYKEIAEKMFKSPRTIDGYRDALFSKLSVTSRTGLVMYAIRAGIEPAAEGL
jgi:DNA-binding NarL/FixJ family response regulator